MGDYTATQQRQIGEGMVEVEQKLNRLVELMDSPAARRHIKRAIKCFELAVIERELYVERAYDGSEVLGMPK